MRKTEQKTIDGITFHCTQLPVMKALRLQPWIGKVLAPALRPILDFQGGIENAEVGTAIEAFFSHIDGDAIEKLVTELFSGMIGVREIEGQKVKFELDDRAQFERCFAGKLATVYKALFFSLSVNYADFIDGLKGAFGPALSTAASRLTSPNTSEALPKSGQ